MNLDISPAPDAAIERLCELIVAAAPRSLVLTGGTTAGAAYELLSSEPGASASTGRRSRSTSATSGASRPTIRAPATASSPTRS